LIDRSNGTSGERLRAMMVLVVSSVSVVPSGSTGSSALPQPSSISTRL
jgi:hypothetical protein